jgi:hypothetical protein
MTSSPTPAVLPDARARIETLEAALASVRVNLLRDPSKVGAVGEFVAAVLRGDTLLEAMVKAEKHQEATPPASDAAVPAGTRAENEDAGLLPWAYGWLDDGGGKHALPYLPTVQTLRGVSSEAFPLYRHPAAAPKVASDTGAGLLREARWYVNDALEAHEHSDGRDLLNRIDAALATPTDATDGATGGGEVAAEIRKIVRWIDQAIERAKKHGNTEGIWLFASQWRTVRHVLATTPGGDLLEQAVGNWQPIDTCSTWKHDHMHTMLAYWTSRGVCETYWDEDDDYDQRPKGWVSPREGWRAPGDQCIPVNQDSVTHWQPMPAKPEALKPAGDGGEA